MTADLTDRIVTVNGVDYHVVESGAGRPVVLLHGFPEFWYSWRHQLPALCGAGYRAVAPDLRGYNLSGKPRGVSEYTVDAIASDIVALIETLGERVHLVGHDWGGIVAWRVARIAPERIRRLVIMNVPHPRAIMRSLRRPSELVKFWYQVAFQPPWLPELLLRRNDFALLRWTMRRAATSGVMSEAVLAEYVKAWQQPGALTAMLSYYRAAYRRNPQRTARRATPAAEFQTLMIWGVRDPVFSVETARSSGEFVKNFRFEAVQGAGHFVQWEAPGRVNELLLEFLNS